MAEKDLIRAREEAAWLRKRLAQAWDEGYNAGCADGEVGHHVSNPIPNPYKD